jgi:hypothetical protein
MIVTLAFHVAYFWQYRREETKFRTTKVSVRLFTDLMTGGQFNQGQYADETIDITSNDGSNTVHNNTINLLLHDLFSWNQLR